MFRPGRASAHLREFEFVVLLAVLALDGEAFPLAIRDEIERRSGRAPSRAAVFITLERLEEKGLLVSRFGAATPVRGGRPKRFFRLTAAGLRASRQSFGFVMAMGAGLRAVLKVR